VSTYRQNRGLRQRSSINSSILPAQSSTTTFTPIQPWLNGDRSGDYLRFFQELRQCISEICLLSGDRVVLVLMVGLRLVEAYEHYSQAAAPAFVLVPGPLVRAALGVKGIASRG
jgi:hypothetical protein